MLAWDRLEASHASWCPRQLSYFYWITFAPHNQGSGKDTKSYSLRLMTTGFAPFDFDLTSRS